MSEVTASGGRLGASVVQLAASSVSASPCSGI